ncbi:MAG: hypothetical protein J7L38_06040 [Thermoproteales archaeon]|nr:hypothetical protein [Thermoproteales archaeon]
MQINIIYDGNYCIAYNIILDVNLQELGDFAKFIDRLLREGFEILSINQLKFLSPADNKRAFFFVLLKKPLKEPVLKEGEEGYSMEHLRKGLIEYYMRVYGPIGRQILERDLLNIIEKEGVGIGEAMKRLYHRIYK